MTRARSVYLRAASTFSRRYASIPVAPIVVIGIRAIIVVGLVIVMAARIIAVVVISMIAIAWIISIVPVTRVVAVIIAPVIGGVLYERRTGAKAREIRA
jgi:hypothetical protein